ncbi:MAG: DUF1178 family protein [Litorimonas sp.]
MIKYTLRCARDHGFEGWFGSSADYDVQADAGLLACPECGSKQVDKAIMAPAVRRSDKSVSTQSAEMVAAIRTEIAKNCDDVGDRFTDEARAMHLGEKPSRGIYGKATPKQAKAMAEEGIAALPLPDMLDPKRAKGKLN